VGARVLLLTRQGGVDGLPPQRLLKKCTLSAW
jgi:hypothetical protein